MHAIARGFAEPAQKRYRVLERDFDERRPVRHALGRDDCAPQIAFALSLTAAWLGLIGFGLMQLIDLL